MKLRQMFTSRRFWLYMFVGALGIFEILGVTITREPVARAQVAPLVFCTGGSVSVNYSPGMILTAQNINVAASANVTTCASTSLPSGTTATGTMTTLGPSVSCLIGGSSGTAEIYWSTGETSSVNMISNHAVHLNGSVIATATGMITSGKFQGKQLLIEAEMVNLDQTACLSAPGVTSLNGNIISVLVQ